MQNHGPLFHRWLPDGKKDSIAIDVGHPNYDLKIWFVRRGFVKNGFIEFDSQRNEVDSEIVPKQAVLYAGPLMGLLKIEKLTDAEVQPIREKKIGDDQYVLFGRRIIKLLFPHLHRFINILRTNYGQYWLPELENWDSRTSSLGNYCARYLNLEWSVDGGKNWARFEPNSSGNAIIRLDNPMNKDCRKYLTKEDWQELSKVVQEKFEPSFAASMLAQAHQSFDQGNLKYAFVEAATALELVINEIIHTELQDSSHFGKTQKFRELPPHVKMLTALVLRGFKPMSAQDVEQAIKAIDMRRKVVHEGQTPPGTEDTSTKITALLRIIAELLPGPKFKFPSANHGNAVKTQGEWEKDYKK